MKEGEPKFKEQEESQEKPQPSEEPERTQGLIRVVGLSPEKQQEILAEKKKLFDSAIPLESALPAESNVKELEITPDKQEIINTTLLKMPGFVEKYGGKMPPIMRDHIFIIDYNSLTEKEKNQMKKNNTRSAYSSVAQRIALFFDSENQDNEDFGVMLAHEILHFSSFQSVNAKEVQDKPKFFGLFGGKPGETRLEVTPRTTGLSLVRKKGKKYELYFGESDEAITAVLTNKFYDENLYRLPAMQQDTKRIKTSIGEWNSKWHPRGTYHEQETDLWRTISDIQQKNIEKFKTKEDVFKLFAEAYFTGHKLKLARAVEKTYGKGSFKELGKDKKNRRLKIK